MPTLYRKYRPRTFAEVIGQDHIVKTLQSAIGQGKIAHAYLFAGPRGTGKTTTARLLAKAVNCPEGDSSEPCQQCDICKQFDEGTSLDLIEIDAASNRGIDEIRELREKVKFPPHLTKYKIYIIDEVHMLTREAFNALLKTLEEPPEHAIFVLATTELTKVPATILSRCQVFEFHKVGQDELLKRLQFISQQEKVEISEEALRLVAARAQGAVRDAESLLGQLFAQPEPIELTQAQQVLGVPDISVVAQLTDLLIERQTAKLLGLVNKVVTQGKEPRQLAEAWAEYLRQVMLAKVGPELVSEVASELTVEQQKRLQKQAKQASMDMLNKALLAFNERIGVNWQDHIPQLPIELTIVEVIGLEDDEGDAKDSQAAGDQTVTITKEKPVTKVVAKEEPATLVAKEEEPVCPAPEATKPNAASVKEICGQWSQVVDKVSKFQKPLGVLLRLCQPLSLEEDQLTLALKYAFHKEQLDDRRNRIQIETILEEVYGQKLRLKVVILDNLEPVKVEEVDGGSGDNGDKETIDDAMKMFGGRIVK